LILSAVAVIALGQILFKLAARNISIAPDSTYIAIVNANLYPIALIIAAVLLYSLSTIAWIQALRTVPLSIAFMFNSLAFVLVPSAAFLLFGETIPRYFLPGLIMIIGGIFLISRG
jgi:drug/metabolite transporter (DMT)-like permease